MVDKQEYRQLRDGEYGNVYAKDRGTCYICGTNLAGQKLIKLTAHEIFVLELYCKATNNTPPRGFTYFCKDRTDCDKWIAQRDLAMRVAPPTAPAPIPYHPKPSVTIAKRDNRSRNKYG